jgi:hypothetical protein
MIVMHGLFDMMDNVGEVQFQESFDQFSERLKANSMVLNCRFMRHQDHDGYNAEPPPTKYYVSVEFSDMDAAEQCWDYIQENKEPIKSLHTAVFSKIQNSRFFLTSTLT